MFQELKMVLQAHARVKRYEVSDKFYSCKMEENSFVSEHILKCLGCTTTYLSWELSSQMSVLLIEFFNHCHQAIKASR